MLILAEIGVFLPKFCFVNLRQLSVNRNSVSVNFAETIYGRTLLKDVKEKIITVIDDIDDPER